MRIPVDSIRGRSATEESKSHERIAKTGIAVQKILAAQTGKEALAVILNSFPAKTPSESYGTFLREMRLEFASSSKKSSSAVWDALRSEPEFETAVIAHLKQTVPAIFKNKYNRSLYEDIEYALFLLGSPKDFDVLEDIRLGSMQGLSRLFARRHSAITRELSAVRTLQSERA